jgi:ABC-2 type transport system permease protein
VVVVTNLGVGVFVVMAAEEGATTLAQVAGLFSPFTLVDGVQVWLFDGPASTPAPPEGAGMGILFCLVTLVVIACSVGAMLLRYRKAAAA